jgi:hypothetical protein
MKGTRKAKQRYALPNPWWVGQHALCSHCPWSGTVQKEDRVLSTGRSDYGEKFALFRCPECGAWVEVAKLIELDTSVRRNKSWPEGA